MKLYPAIDLHEGKAVRLFKGDYNQVTDYGDPKSQALKWKEAGATFLHLVDLDGAKDGGAIINIAEESYVLPESGGIGTTPFRAAGLVMVVTALFSVLLKKRRERRCDGR